MFRFLGRAGAEKQRPPNMVEFLLARLAEEQEAAEAVAIGWRWFTSSTSTLGVLSPELRVAIERYAPLTYPARMLADIEAKREIVQACSARAGDNHTPPSDGFSGLSLAVDLLVRSYRDHPDYDQEWSA